MRSATFDADWRRVVRRLLALMAVEQQHEAPRAPPMRALCALLPCGPPTTRAAAPAALPCPVPHSARALRCRQTLSMHEYPGVAGVSQSFPELSREGRGTRVRGGAGLIWSGFTPGDDSPALGYVPSSMLI